MHHKFQTDREIILSQIDDVKKRREQEKRETVEFQQREMARAQRMLQEEEEERERERARHKAAHDRLLIENEKDKSRKKVIAEKQREEEQRMQREYEYVVYVLSVQIVTDSSLIQGKTGTRRACSIHRVSETIGPAGKNWK